jgi:DUF4097 and DUF4098 domain-containing protein YvlB
MQSRASWLGTTLLFLVTLGLSGCHEMMLGGIQDNVQKSFSVEPGGKLTLDSDSGSVEVMPGAGNMVAIQVDREVKAATKEDADRILKDLTVDFQQEGKNVLVRARMHRDNFYGGSWGNRIRLKFKITVPSKYDLDLKTGGGSIRVDDLEGIVVARTSGGSLHFGRITGPVNANTSGGSINLEGVSGPVDVNTSGGSIRIGKVIGPLKAHTSGGSISVDEVMGEINASTSGGSVNATISKQPGSDCELKTSGGSVRVTLSRNLNLNLLAKCSGGSIHTDLPVTVQGEFSKHRLEAKLNAGGPQLYLHTSGGGININELK